MAIITLNNRAINRSDTASSGQVFTATSATAADFQDAGGKVLQVVSNTQTSGASTTASSFEFATNCPTLNITPAATSSKILLIAAFGSVENSGGTGIVTIFRDSTNLGDSSNGFMFIQPDGTTYAGGGTNFLDSPSTTSQVTYQIRIMNSSGTFDFGRGNTRSTLTAIEIGA